jgi:hypothetical protein
MIALGWFYQRTFHRQFSKWWTSTIFTMFSSKSDTYHHTTCRPLNTAIFTIHFHSLWRGQSHRNALGRRISTFSFCDIFLSSITRTARTCCKVASDALEVHSSVRIYPTITKTLQSGWHRELCALYCTKRRSWLGRIYECCWWPARDGQRAAAEYSSIHRWRNSIASI